MRALLLAAFVLLPGCILAGGPDDLTLVCERRTGMPAHPYPPEVLASFTNVEGDLAPEARGAVFQDAADRLLTPGAAPYRTFESRLHQDAPGLWILEMNGTWKDEEREGVDHYRLAYALTDGGARIDPPGAPVEAPERLRFAAQDVVNRSRELNATREARPNVGSAVWDESLPSCVRITYYRQTLPGGPPPMGDPPTITPDATSGDAEPWTTQVWVNLARGQVVYVKHS